MYFECYSNIPASSSLGAKMQTPLSFLVSCRQTVCDGRPVDQEFWILCPGQPTVSAGEHGHTRTHGPDTDPRTGHIHTDFKKPEGEEGKGKVAVRFRSIVEETSTQHSRHTKEQRAKGAQREGREGPLAVCALQSKGRRAKGDGSKGGVKGKVPTWPLSS